MGGGFSTKKNAEEEKEEKEKEGKREAAKVTKKGKRWCEKKHLVVEMVEK